MATQSDYELSSKYFFYHKDGLLDIFIGLGILMAGASLWVGMFWLAGSWVAIFLPLWIAARKSITFRYGDAGEIVSGRNVKLGLSMATLCGVLLLCAMVGLMSSWGFEKLEPFRSFVDAYIDQMIGFGLALLLVVTAVFMHIPRYWLHAVLTVAVFFTGQAFGWAFWISMTLTGGLIGLVGLIVLGYYLREHSASV